MLGQIKQLTCIGLINIFGINEVRHTKDSGKKQRFALLASVWIFLAVLFIFYMLVLSTAYIQMGLADVIPMYFYTAASMIILLFSIYKAGDMVFSLKNYEMQASWPVSSAAIVVSRFAIMYVTNLLFSLIVMLPGLGIYGWIIKPSITFYIYGLLGILFLPMFPLCIALIIGAAATAIGSRMRHKSIGIALLTLVFSTVIIAASMMMSKNAEQMSMSMLENLALFITELLRKIYPPAWVFGKAVVEGRFLWICGLCAVTVILFGCVAALLGRYFVSICSLLNTTSAKNSFKLGNQRKDSRMKALWKRELRRYFASSTYISNTLIGYILMLFASASLCFFGPEQLEMMIGIPGLVRRLWPLFLGFMPAMMPTTSCSISMEGKSMWRLQSLPVSPKEIYNGKILANLSLAAPFYAVSVILSIGALRPHPAELILMILVPACYIVFSAVSGLAVNMALPLLKWESEVQVIKQSGAAFASMIAAFVVWLVPTGILAVFPQLPVEAVMLAVLMILGGLTAALYVKIYQREMDYE